MVTVTKLGKIITILFMILGAMYLAMSLNVFGNAFFHPTKEVRLNDNISTIVLA